MAQEIKWTPSQLDAIEARADKILVSAAAGSGKSTVLTKRIINAVTDELSPYDIDRLMIVTFTRASAEDLKNKITRALRNAVLEKPSSKHLNEQLLKLPGAKINTIHGVCFALIKRNFEALGLPASVSIADETTTLTLRLDVMTKLLDFCFAGGFEAIPNFADFAENFIMERDDALPSILLSIYDKMKNEPDGLSEKFLDNYGTDGTDFIKTPYGKIISSRMRMLIDYYLHFFDEAQKYFLYDENYSKYTEQFREEARYATLIDNALKLEDTDLLRSVLSTPPTVKTPSLKEELKTAEGELYKTERAKFRKEITSIASSIFMFTGAEIDKSAKQTSDIAKKLLLLLSEYDRRFSEAKLKRSCIDFNDIEHYTLKLLYNEDGSISTLAKEISSSLQEIYVDEYQDLNPLQNKIFNALSVNCPIFMVGDIKQSIYGFRGADPSAFAHYKKSFPEYQKGNTQACATVFLSDNFRSAKPITEFSNIISDAMFYTPNNDGIYDYRIPYSESDRLNANVKIEAPPKVTLMNCIRDMSDEETKKKGTYYVEASMVANEISLLIKNGVSPDNIAIILRNAQSSAPIYVNALKARNISVSTEKGAPLFETPEVQLALCLLNCCDNPYRDIFLAGALRSPIFNFSLDDMIRIKTEAKDTSSLFEALTVYTERTGFEKGLCFIEFLSKMRKYALKSTVDRLLWQIYTETSFFAALYDNGRQSEDSANARRTNLISLHELAKSYVSYGQTDLFGFLEKIRVIIEKGKSPTGAKTGGDSVHLITMHSSKGLEFEYCFVCGTSHKFSTADINKDVIFDKDIGLAMRLKDTDRLSVSDTPYRLALSYKAEQVMLDEEMRMLYVALTRAKTKLYVCSSVNEVEKLDFETAFFSRLLHPYTFMRQTSHISWIHTALKMPTELEAQYEILNLTQAEILKRNASSILHNGNNNEEKRLTEDEKNELYNHFKNIITFEYPHKNSVRLPSKLSVSRLYPEILDENAYLGDGVLFADDGQLISPLADTADAEARDNAADMLVPTFMLDQQAVTAAEIGTATHVFMQFCDFNKISESIDDEIQRLLLKRFILPSHASLIDKKAIQRFITSDIFRDISQAKEVNREYRFNIKLPASEFTSNESLMNELSGEYIFVQGIIDCYFRDQNGDITLLDYKTDFVPKDIKGDRKKEDEFFINRHSRQLSYYKTALKLLTKQDVKRTVIFSFNLGRCIEIK
ncbi:MAG: UvrD-helicase domain-containing protein [Clostridia bacterium]|nr:UvrD-helicase domain-containing protein [Clostridia bacterium]